MAKEIIFRAKNFPHVSETFVVSNIAAAIKMGYKVKIIADYINPMHYGSQTQLINSLGIMDFVTVNNIPTNKVRRFTTAFLYLLNFKRFNFFIKYWKFKGKLSLSYIFILKFYETYKNANLFHIHFATLAEEVSILKSIGFFNPKIIVTFHGMDAYCVSKSDRINKTKTYTKFYPIWNKVTVNTLFLKENVLELQCPESKISVIPMAIDLEFYKPKKHPKTIENSSIIKLISVGRLIAFKGHRFGVETVKILINKGYNVHYTIIGYGTLFNTLQALIKTLNLQDHITLFGSATQIQIKKQLEQSDVFLMTSVADQTGRQETQGVVTIEAQAMGLPVVGFKSGGVPYTVTKQTAILVKQKATEAMANAIIQTIEDQTAFKTKSLEARKLAVSKYGLQTMITNFYKDIA